MVIPRRACCLLIVLGSGFLLLPPDGGAAEPTPTRRKDLLAGWDKYDPTIRQAHLERQAAVRAEAARIAAEKPNTPSTAAPAPPAAKEGLLVLPKMTVEGTREKSAAPLPRLAPAEPVMNLQSEPFESPEGRRARLVKVHFTPLEQALGRIRLPLIGRSLEARAGHAEAVASAARELNDLAALLELSALLGLDTPEEARAFREEFLRLYSSRPR